jgi:SRSO17 transposase
MYRHLRRKLMRNGLHNFTTIVPVTVYHQRSYVETYSRYMNVHFMKTVPIIIASVFPFAVTDAFMPVTLLLQAAMDVVCIRGDASLRGNRAWKRNRNLSVTLPVLQDFIGTAPWDHRPLITVLVGQVAERLGAPDGIIAFDPSSFPKRGTHSVGVKRQWCGHRGKVDNCQVGIFMGYVSRHDHAVLDFRLSLPEESGEQVVHGWVTGDDELGRHSRFRGELQDRGERSVLGVPCTTTIRDLEAPLPAYQGRGRRPKAPWQSVTQWRKVLHPTAWRRFTVRDGEKGPVGIEMVTRRVQTRLERKRTGSEEWLVVTRRLHTDDCVLEGKSSPDAREQDGCYRYQYYLKPTGVSGVALQAPSLVELARVIKAGACIEASFKRGKGEAGMDAYQVRTWQGWHHHMALSLIAVWFLLGETHRGQQVTPALILPQVCYGLSLLLEVFCTPGTDYICRQVQRQLLRNESARFYHHRTRQCIPTRKLRREIQ